MSGTGTSCHGRATRCVGSLVNVRVCARAVNTAHADVRGGMCARACPHICPVAVGRAAQGRGQGRCGACTCCAQKAQRRVRAHACLALQLLERARTLTCWCVEARLAAPILAVGRHCGAIRCGVIRACREVAPSAQRRGPCTAAAAARPISTTNIISCGLSLHMPAASPISTTNIMCSCGHPMHMASSCNHSQHCNPSQHLLLAVFCVECSCCSREV